jgi:hypothetical protein
MKIKYITIITAAITVLGFLSGCNPKMEIPSYIWIDSVDFRITDEGTQGTASHKITDVWVTANGKGIGMYQIPARIPILESGPTRLTLLAGIMLGGVPQTRFPYPFYTPYSLPSINLKKGQIDTLLPSFTYTNLTEFDFIEDFESAGIKFKPYGTSAPMTKTSDENLTFHFPKENNNYSGIIELPYKNDSATVYHFEIRTVTPIELTSQNMLDCLMEINFCITHNVEIGMIVHSVSPTIPDKRIEIAKLSGYDTVSTVKPVWKKVYANFTQEIGKATEMKNFDIYIRATINDNEKARFLFDNIKLLHQKN